MGTVHRVGSLEISEDLKFTRTSWKFERIGWLGLAAVLVAGLLGLLGPGIFSSATAGDADGPLRVNYERFGHFEADDRLTVWVNPHGPDGIASFWVEDTYLDHVDIRDIHPRPARIELQQGRKVYFFQATSGGDPVQVRFDLTYKKAGRLAGRLGTLTSPGVEVRQFIYP
jgi:hypothetical protein